MAWRYCGNQIKLWRTQAGVTREGLGKEANYDYEYVKSMEQGRRKPTLRLLEVADEMCGARGMLLAAQDYLKPERFLSYVQDFVRYEADAIAHSSYQPQVIPGLLQTEEYARKLIGAHWPPLDDETIDVRVAARLERQALLEKQTRAFSFAVGEGAVRFPIDSADAHKRQLDHLSHMLMRRNITVQIMPFGGVHPGLEGSFVLLETPEHEHLAFEEGQMTGILYADPAKVSIIMQRHALILQRALSPEESARFITSLAEEL
ncbi:helix-turn-helix transcriptional regulator [Streptomyces sp. NPDC001922]|uniref:helix-turn-helix domain-containing protein n=1 Tax=unclassified Streptomyces TaxID=2593676 RepID=UPI00331FD16C